MQVQMCICQLHYRFGNDLLFIQGVSTHVNTAPQPPRKVKERLKSKDGEKGEIDNMTLLCAYFKSIISTHTFATVH